MLSFRLLTLIDGKKFLGNAWDFLFFTRRTFLVGEDLYIPSDKVLQLHSPIIEGCLEVDGEVYIL